MHRWADRHPFPRNFAQARFFGGQRAAAPKIRPRRVSSFVAAIGEKTYFVALIGGGGRSRSRLASPRPPRTSNSSNSRDPATIDARKPPWLCADPHAPSAVP